MVIVVRCRRYRIRTAWIKDQPKAPWGLYSGWARREHNYEQSGPLGRNFCLV
jgi:hypothetical protein